MTNHGVWTGRDELVILADALHECKVWTEGSVTFDTDDCPRDDEGRTEDERDGQLTGFRRPERVQDYQNGIGRPMRSMQRAEDDHRFCHGS